MIRHKNAAFRNPTGLSLVKIREIRDNNTATKEMKLHDLLPLLDEMAPLAHAEDFDNVGLLTGDPASDITGLLVCHDALEPVIDEAIAKNCNLVVCFHPILFSGLKKITGKIYSYVSVQI